jgi:hypothetical protein
MIIVKLRATSSRQSDDGLYVYAEIAIDDGGGEEVPPMMGRIPYSHFQILDALLHGEKYEKLKVYTIHPPNLTT